MHPAIGQPLVPAARCGRMTQPKPHDELPPAPPHGGEAANNPTGETPHGIPPGTTDNEPKAKPTSDREQTESAANKTGKA